MSGKEVEPVKPSSADSGSPSRDEKTQHERKYEDAPRLRHMWQEPVDASLANMPLLACCFVTGLLDTTMFQGM